MILKRVLFLSFTIFFIWLFLFRNLRYLEEHFIIHQIISIISLHITLYVANIFNQNSNLAFRLLSQKQSILHHHPYFPPWGETVEQHVVSSHHQLPLWGQMPIKGLHVVHLTMHVCIHIRVNDINTWWAWIDGYHRTRKYQLSPSWRNNAETETLR